MNESEKANEEFVKSLTGDQEAPERCQQAVGGEACCDLFGASVNSNSASPVEPDLQSTAPDPSARSPDLSLVIEK